MTNVVRRPRALLAGLAAVVLAAALAPALMSAPAGAAAPTRTLAEATLHSSTKVVVTAALVAIYRRSAGGNWRLLDQRLIGRAGGWFWCVLTDQASVCAFNLSETPTLRIGVSLSPSPSTGCSPTYRYQLQNSHLIGG